MLERLTEQNTRGSKRSSSASRRPKQKYCGYIKEFLPPLLCNLKEKKMPQRMSGPVYFYECPAQYLIPYYFIISGVIGLLLLIPSILCCGNQVEPSTESNVCCLIIGLFLLAFFITGNVWVYSIYAPNYTDHTAANYCRKELYLYAFWMTTLVYIFLGLPIFIRGCMFFCDCFLFYRDSSEVPEAKDSAMP
ncbi:transmembrane protein 272-like isoform X2 [Lissotriton helveticus]